MNLPKLVYIKKAALMGRFFYLYALQPFRIKRKPSEIFYFVLSALNFESAFLVCLLFCSTKSKYSTLLLAYIKIIH